MSSSEDEDAPRRRRRPPVIESKEEKKSKKKVVVKPPPAKVATTTTAAAGSQGVKRKAPVDAVVTGSLTPPVYTRRRMDVLPSYTPSSSSSSSSSSPPIVRAGPAVPLPVSNKRKEPATVIDLTEEEKKRPKQATVAAAAFVSSAKRDIVLVQDPTEIVPLADEARVYYDRMRNIHGQMTAASEDYFALDARFAFGDLSKIIVDPRGYYGPRGIVCYPPFVNRSRAIAASVERLTVEMAGLVLSQSRAVVRTLPLVHANPEDVDSKAAAIDDANTGIISNLFGIERYGLMRIPLDTMPSRLLAHYTSMMHQTDQASGAVFHTTELKKLLSGEQAIREMIAVTNTGWAQPDQIQYQTQDGFDNTNLLDHLWSPILIIPCDTVIHGTAADVPATQGLLLNLDNAQVLHRYIELIERVHFSGSEADTSAHKRALVTENFKRQLSTRSHVFDRSRDMDARILMLPEFAAVVTALQPLVRHAVAPMPIPSAQFAAARHRRQIEQSIIFDRPITELVPTPGGDALEWYRHPIRKQYEQLVAADTRDDDLSSAPEDHFGGRIRAVDLFLARYRWAHQYRSTRFDAVIKAWNDRCRADIPLTAEEQEADELKIVNPLSRSERVDDMALSVLVCVYEHMNRIPVDRSSTGSDSHPWMELVRFYRREADVYETAKQRIQVPVSEYIRDRYIGPMIDGTWNTQEQPTTVGISALDVMYIIRVHMMQRVQLSGVVSPVDHESLASFYAARLKFGQGSGGENGDTIFGALRPEMLDEISSVYAKIADKTSAPTLWSALVVECHRRFIRMYFSGTNSTHKWRIRNLYSKGDRLLRPFRRGYSYSVGTDADEKLQEIAAIEQQSLATASAVVTNWEKARHKREAKLPTEVADIREILTAVDSIYAMFPLLMDKSTAAHQQDAIIKRFRSDMTDKKEKGDNQRKAWMLAIYAIRWPNAHSFSSMRLRSVTMDTDLRDLLYSSPTHPEDDLYQSSFHGMRKFTLSTNLRRLMRAPIASPSGIVATVVAAAPPGLEEEEEEEEENEEEEEDAHRSLTAAELADIEEEDAKEEKAELGMSLRTTKRERDPLELAVRKELKEREKKKGGGGTLTVEHGVELLNGEEIGFERTLAQSVAVAALRATLGLDESKSSSIRPVTEGSDEIVISDEIDTKETHHGKFVDTYPWEMLRSDILKRRRRMGLNFIEQLRTFQSATVAERKKLSVALLKLTRAYSTFYAPFVSAPDGKLLSRSWREGAVGGDDILNEAEDPYGFHLATVVSIFDLCDPDRLFVVPLPGVVLRSIADGVDDDQLLRTHAAFFAAGEHHQFNVQHMIHSATKRALTVMKSPESDLQDMALAYRMTMATVATGETSVSRLWRAILSDSLTVRIQQMIAIAAGVYDTGSSSMDLLLPSVDTKSESNSSAVVAKMQSYIDLMRSNPSKSSKSQLTKKGAFTWWGILSVAQKFETAIHFTSRFNTAHTTNALFCRVLLHVAYIAQSTIAPRMPLPPDTEIPTLSEDDITRFKACFPRLNGCEFVPIVVWYAILAIREYTTVAKADGIIFTAPGEEKGSILRYFELYVIPAAAKVVQASGSPSRFDDAYQAFASKRDQWGGGKTLEFQDELKEKYYRPFAREVASAAVRPFVDVLRKFRNLTWIYNGTHRGQPLGAPAERDVIFYQRFPTDKTTPTLELEHAEWRKTQVPVIPPEFYTEKFVAALSRRMTKAGIIRSPTMTWDRWFLYRGRTEDTLLDLPDPRGLLLYMDTYGPDRARTSAYSDVWSLVGGLHGDYKKGVAPVVRSVTVMTMEARSQWRKLSAEKSLYDRFRSLAIGDDEKAASEIISKDDVSSGEEEVEGEGDEPDVEEEAGEGEGEGGEGDDDEASPVL
jgi:hypothetical protein